MKNKTLRLLVIIFAIMGFLYVGIGVVNQISFGHRTNGMISMIGQIEQVENNKPTIRYTVDGIHYQMVGVTSYSFFQRGQEYTISVDPADPTRAIDPSLQIISVVFASIGAAFLLTALILLLINRHLGNKYEELLAFGQRVSCEIVEIKEIKSVTVGRKHPYRLFATCEHPQTGEATTVSSQSIWENRFAVGDRVDVLFDPINPKKYVFDLEEHQTWA